MTAAVFGLVGVIVGSLLTWAKEIVLDVRARKRRARYLAIRLVCLLDDYSRKCSVVVRDDGVTDADGEYYPGEQEPDPPAYPLDLDWSSIDYRLAYELLKLPNDATDVDEAISFTFTTIDGPPDYSIGFEERQYEYAKLALRSGRLAQELRDRYDIPADEAAAFDPLERCREKVTEVEAARAAREREDRAFWSGGET